MHDLKYKKMSIEHTQEWLIVSESINKCKCVDYLLVIGKWQSRSFLVIWTSGPQQSREAVGRKDLLVTIAQLCHQK